MNSDIAATTEASGAGRPELPPLVLVGGYTAEAGGQAAGLTSYRARNGGYEEVAQLALPSPSYLIADPVRPVVYATTEAAPASVVSLRVSSDGTLDVLSVAVTGGDHGCHLALSPSGNLLLVANYGSGSVSSFAVAADGSLSERRDLVQFAGSGPDQDRQEAPHAHQAVWTGDTDDDDVLACDLGTDTVHRLRVDPSGRFTAAASIRVTPGSGPRHCVLLGVHLVVAGELNGELWLGVRTGDHWEEAQRIATSTAPTGSLIQPSALVHDGRRLYVANRGVGTVGVFELVDGRLERLAEFDCGGSWPRDLTLSSGRLWVANERDHAVTVFARGEAPQPRLEFTFSSGSPTRVLVL